MMGHPKGYRHSEETKRKIGKSNSVSLLGCIPWNKGLNKNNNEPLRKLSESRKGKGNPMFGKVVSQETIEKRRSKMIGHEVSEETRKKIGEGNKRKIISLETRKRISETLRQNKMIPWNKNKGYLYSKKMRDKMSLSQKRRFIINQKKKGGSFSKSHKLKLKLCRRKQVTPMRDTSIDVKIQNFLKKLGIEFFTHQYMKEIEHGYQCDILIPSMNLVIECDGDYWHKYPTGREIDYIRTLELIQKGFKVLRLWEHEIKIMDLNTFKRTWDTFNQ
jgi:very-short-patch-repair endonuclease